MVRAWLAGDLAAGVPGGETGHETADRVLGVLEDVADQFRGETVLVVSHGGVILALWGAIAPGSPDAPANDLVLNGSSYVFEHDADGWRVGAVSSATPISPRWTTSSTTSSTWSRSSAGTSRSGPCTWSSAYPWTAPSRPRRRPAGARA